eukprot:Protomagalhaensia_sp_Gyna_25__1967@NODE_204_length_4418_cov_135_785111_g158_i0_p1_GENE_NODE_204_length_4418_cov_135_785111_g158_i0NODE_204_length_4418_cov_135_785111_g158_i0_p1_ORF_typecomplete_len848_score134_12EXS/PF03124_14/1_3e68SPX/PF03105_19/5_6e23XdhC_C/PF13478_6/0_46CorA/PF01544_18/0_43CorA/PF01544_18/7_8e02_NODE_204_length_4418_cov_135_785111_g158_i011493692
MAQPSGNIVQNAMKFGVKLETYAVPEWSDKYLRYNDLKAFLKKRKRKLQCPPRSFMSGASLWKRFASRDSEGPDSDPYNNAAEVLEIACQDFNSLLEKEVNKVEEHYYFETCFLDDRLEGVQAELDQLEEEAEENPTDKKKIRAHDAHRARLQKTIVALWECFDKLDGFAQLNHMAVYKILKKRDKVFRVSRMAEAFGQYQERLQKLKRKEETKDYMKSLYSRARRISKSDPFEVEGLAAAVQTHFMRQHRSQPNWVPFFLGVCLVVAVDIAIAFFIPPTNPRWTIEGFVANFPIFRLCLWLDVLLWATGVVIFTYENYGVNYKFLLDVEPRSELSSTSVFKVASEMTAIWILSFGAFFIDYRFGIFGPSSAHYWIYPLGAVVSQILALSLLADSASRRGIARVLWETLKCSVMLYPALTLSLNISGDILTSIVKPLGDIEYIMCYYATGVFHEEMAKCSLDGYLVPLFTAFPFWVRFLQCLSRYTHAGQDPRRHVHLWNMGKYLVSMSVVVLTSIHWDRLDLSVYAQKLIWVFQYLCASLYSMTWDFVFDWGLIPDAENLLRAEDQMMYPDWIYYAISIFNLCGRLTWALTLIPVTLVSDKIVTNAIIYLFVGTMEIVRRSAWMMVRLENEHLTNSSSYRAMLWVPILREDSPETEDLVKERAADEETWIRCAKKQLPRFSPLDQLEESLLQTIETNSNAGCSTPPDTIVMAEGPPPPRRKHTASKLRSQSQRPSSFGLATLAARCRHELRSRKERISSSEFERPEIPVTSGIRASSPAAAAASVAAQLLVSPPISETYLCAASPSSAIRRVRREIAPGITCVDVSIPVVPSITISPAAGERAMGP